MGCIVSIWSLTLSHGNLQIHSWNSSCTPELIVSSVVSYFLPLIMVWSGWFLSWFILITIQWINVVSLCGWYTDQIILMDHQYLLVLYWYFHLYYYLHGIHDIHCFCDHRIPTHLHEWYQNIFIIFYNTPIIH